VKKIGTYVIVPDLVELSSNQKRIHSFSYAEVLEENNFFSNNNSIIKIEYKVISQLDRPSNVFGKYHYFQASKNGKTIFYSRPYLGKHNMCMILKMQKIPKLIVNKAYIRFARFRMNNVYPPGMHLTDLTSILLLEKGYSPLHSACIEKNGQALLIFAPPNTGKTLASLTTVKEYGFNFLAEDITVTDGIKVYACPYTTTFRYYKELESGIIKGFQNFISVNIPIFAPFYKSRNSTILDHISKNQIVCKANIASVVVLERGEGGFEKLDSSLAKKKLLALNRYEFHYWRNPLLLALSYFKNDFNPQLLMSIEERLIEKIVNKNDIYILKLNDPNKYASYLSEFFLEKYINRLNK